MDDTTATDGTVTDGTVGDGGAAPETPTGIPGAVAAGISGGLVEITLRLYRTTDDRLVVEDHPDAAFLFATPGMRILLSEAHRYGLLSPPDAETTTDPETTANTETTTAPSDTATPTTVTATATTTPTNTATATGSGTARRKRGR